MQYDLLCNQSNQKKIIIASSPLILGGLSNLEINQAKDAQQLPCLQTAQLKLAGLINSRTAPPRLGTAASSPELALGSEMGKHLGKPGSVAVRPAVLQKAQSQLPSYAVVLSCHMARRDWRVTKGCSWPSSNRNKAVPCKSPNPSFKMHQFLCTYSNTGRFYIILPRDLFSRQILNFQVNSNFLLLSLIIDNSPNDEIFWLQSGFCWKEASSFLRNSTISLCNELLHTQCSIIY